MANRKNRNQSGEVNPLLISNIITGILVVALTGASIWAYRGYSDYKNNSDKKVATAEEIARTEQKKQDEKEFLEKEKIPTRTFKGPADLGSVSFSYPKTWSVYVAKQSTSLEAYLHPNFVPTVSNTQPFALRVLVEDRPYETVINLYDNIVKKGDLKSNTAKIEGFSGIRLDGKFTNDREGSAVIFKVRDKTLTIATDASAYKNDFDNTILKSLKFNP